MKDKGFGWPRSMKADDKGLAGKAKDTKTPWVKTPKPKVGDKAKPAMPMKACMIKPCAKTPPKKAGCFVAGRGCGRRRVGWRSRVSGSGRRSRLGGKASRGTEREHRRTVP